MVIEEHTFSNAVVSFSHQAPHTSLPRKVSWATWRMSVTNKEVWIFRITFLFLLFRIQHTDGTARQGIPRFFPLMHQEELLDNRFSAGTELGILCFHHSMSSCQYNSMSYLLILFYVVHLCRGFFALFFRHCRIRNARVRDWACFFRCSAGLRVDIPKCTFPFFSSKCLSKSPVYSLRLL